MIQLVREARWRSAGDPDAVRPPTGLEELTDEELLGLLADGLEASTDGGTAARSRCRWCGAPLVRRDLESSSAFAKRKHCSICGRALGYRA